MEIIIKDKMPDGTHIQIEDWSKDYPKVHSFGDTIATYPIATRTDKYGIITPNKTFRCEIQAKTHEEALEIFENLKTGKKTIYDYKNLIDKAQFWFLG